VSGGELARLRCAGVWRFTDTYLDGEFGDVERTEFEEHLEGCEPCRKIVREQAAWKQAVRAAAPRETAPESLRRRLESKLAEAQVAKVASSDLAAARQKRSLKSQVLRYSPYAAAAGVVLALVVTHAPGNAVTEDVIAKHQRNLPIEVTGRSDDVRRWYSDKVDFPVRPPSFGTHGMQNVALRGGRLANVRDHQAAYLMYDVDGNRVSVFIFDPGEMPMEARRHAVIGNREVYFDGEHGYNVALYRDHGVGYAIASDMDQGQMMRLVSAAVSH
jgi:mycothiol system anti-sigma-R factor